MPSQHQLDSWLHAGITAAKANQLPEARFYLLDVVEHDPMNEVAWFWLHQASDRLDDQRICLENLLIINPANPWAREALLNHLDSRGLPPILPPYPPVITPYPPAVPHDLFGVIVLRVITAFWGGISLVLVGGGIIAISEWVWAILRSRGLTYFATIEQWIGLLVALMLLALSLMASIITLGLLTRSAVGFYGSLLLALMLLLLGPIMSLIATPPSYLGAVVTGGVSGVVVLLTLASISEIESP